MHQASGQVATMMCLSHCQVSNGLPFSLSGNAEARSQVVGSRACANDYIVFPGGFSFPLTDPPNQRDRFCGSLLSQNEEDDSPQTICSKLKIQRISSQNIFICFLDRHSQTLPVALPDERWRDVEHHSRFSTHRQSRLLFEFRTEISIELKCCNIEEHTPNMQSYLTSKDNFL